DSAGPVRATRGGGGGGRVPGVRQGRLRFGRHPAGPWWSMAVDGATDRSDPERPRLFVTGQLARAALERTLVEMKPPFPWKVAALRIKGAALMTTAYVRRTLRTAEGEGEIILPGLCQADAEALGRHFGVVVRKGPKDLRDLPEFFGGPAEAYD